MKKAQGLSMNTIIIAAIAIIVLVVIVVIFSGRIRLFSAGLGTCDGICVTDASQCGDDMAPTPTKNCDQNGDGTAEIKGDAVCCKSLI